jgi:glycosyltransferase involved in cell wall biosynthesis
VKVALITGPCPAGGCGVGDYTACLGNALNASGIETHLITSDDWNLLCAFRESRRLREQKFDILHIQYPTAGFGTQLGSQGLALLQSCVVTIHEASQRHILRKLSLLPFMVRPKHVIFTSEFERQFVTKRVPGVSRISSIIPVASNIRAFPEARQRTLSEIVHFGLILPGKGLEEVVELSRLIKSGGLAFKVRIIGRPHPEHMEYFEKLRSATAELPVIWELDRSEEQVAERLASSAVAYFPFPDGASERRTSLKAALANGVAVVTNRGSHTPANMESSLTFAGKPKEALIAACALIESQEERTKLAKNAGEYLQQCSWERVAELHLAIYTKLLSPKYGADPIKVRSVQENP